MTTTLSAHASPGMREHGFVLRPLLARDAEIDHAAVMETREELRRWEQSAWPADDFTVEANREDLTDLEQRHRAGRAFTYAVLDPDETESRGCVYVFPTTAAFLTRAEVTQLGEQLWDDVQAVVYFWVRSSHRALELDRALLAALRTWFADEWMLTRTVFVTNEQYGEQLALLRGAGLTEFFEVREPGKPGTYIAFG